MANTSRELERERNRNKAARLVACEGRKNIQKCKRGNNLFIDYSIFSSNFTIVDDFQCQKFNSCCKVRLIFCTVREIEGKFLSMKLLYGVCANDSNCFDGILSTLLPSVTSTDRCRFFIPAVLGGDDLLGSADHFQHRRGKHGVKMTAVLNIRI